MLVNFAVGEGRGLHFTITSELLHDAMYGFWSEDLRVILLDLEEGLELQVGVRILF